MATSAQAQGGPPPEAGGPPQANTVTVGVGIGVTKSYDGALDYKLIPGGTLRGKVKGHYFQLNGLQFFVDAIPNDPQRKVDIEFCPVAGVSFNRTVDVSNSRVAVLGELDTAIELGARLPVGLRGVGFCWLASLPCDQPLCRIQHAGRPANVPSHGDQHRVRG